MPFVIAIDTIPGDIQIHPLWCFRYVLEVQNRLRRKTWMSRGKKMKTSKSWQVVIQNFIHGFVWVRYFKLLVLPWYTPAIPDKVAGDVESSFRDGLLDADIVRDPKKRWFLKKKRSTVSSKISCRVWWCQSWNHSLGIQAHWNTLLFANSCVGRMWNFIRIAETLPLLVPRSWLLWKRKCRIDWKKSCRPRTRRSSFWGSWWECWQCWETKKFAQVGECTWNNHCWSVWCGCGSAGSKFLEVFRCLCHWEW